MANIVLPHTAVTGQPVPTIGTNANFVAIRDAFNTYAVQTDVAKTITVTHTWSASQTFSAGFTTAGATVFGADVGATDGLYDLGKAGATRFRDAFFSRNLTVGGALTVTGAATISSTLAVAGQITGSAGAVIDYSGATILTVRNTGVDSNPNISIQNDARVWQLQTVGARNDSFEINDGTAGVVRLAITTGGQVLIGTTVTSGTGAGDIVIANTKAVRGVIGASAYSLVQVDANSVVQIGEAPSGVHAGIGVRAAAALPGGAAAYNGVIAVDSTNNRFVYYSGGNRYYLTGTAF